MTSRISLLRVIEPVGAFLLEQRKDLAFDAEALVFGEVPVEDVQLDRFHAVEVALDHSQRHEVAARVDHQAAPRKARLIVDGDRRRGESLRRDAHQLQKGLQPVQDAQRIGAPSAPLLSRETFR